MGERTRETLRRCRLFSENSAIRRIAPDGTVSTVVSNIRIPCTNPLDAPGLPHLRGLDIDQDGSLYVAANGCRSLIRITPSGDVRTIMTAEAPWSPTGVAVFRGEVFVLEYGSGYREFARLQVIEP